MVNIFVTAYTACNLGDDLFITILCNRYPLVHFYLYCPNQYAKAFESIRNITVISEFNDNEIYNIIDTIDLQIMIGGSLFIQPQNVSKIKLKFESVISCRLSPNIPFIIIGANFGPFTELSHLQYYQNWFKTVDDVCFRDIYSYRLFNHLDNIRWSPDVVFNLTLPNVKKTKSIVISCIYNNNRIGLPQFNNDAYCQKICDISKQYIDRGYKVIFASFCVAQNDTNAIQHIYSLMPKSYAKQIGILEYKGDINTFLNDFLQAEYIIGTRFHSIILGWKAGIPVFPISYNSKTFNVLRDYGFVGRYCTIEEFPNLSFEQINDNYIKNYIFDCSNLITSADKQFKKIDNMINNINGGRNE